jgi:hypothetical protein
MKWEEVKARFPNEWVVLEAVVAYSKDGYRYIEEVAVIDRFNHSMDAMHRYDKLHKEQPHKEFCFFHTSRLELIARERYAGVPGPNPANSPTR